MNFILMWFFALASLILIIYSLFDIIYLVANFFIRKSEPVPLIEIKGDDLTIQVPIYNTGTPILTLLNSIKDNVIPYEIQLLDSSNDKTTTIIESFFGAATKFESTEYWVKTWGNIHLIHFKQKRGSKAWALNQGSVFVKTPFIAVFDSDWRIESSFFKNLLPIIKDDEKIGYVQASWQSSNENENSISYTDAISIESEHLIEDVFRNHFRIPFTIHGSAFIVRTKLIQSMQWRDQFLSEDVDLALRINFKGYCGVYVKPQKSEGRTCSSLHEFYRQKGRWIEGRSQMLRSHAADLLKTKKLLLIKKIFVLHYLAYFMKTPLVIFLFMLAAILGAKYLKVCFLVLLLGFLSRAALNVRTISFKEHKNYFAAILEPTLFLLFAVPYSYRSLRGLFLRKAVWS